VKPALSVKGKGEISLSGDSLTGLMRAVLDKGKPFRFRAKGFSMSPFIKDGDVVTVARKAGSRPRTGDVVAFLLPAAGRVALHRVVGEGRDVFFVKGDNVPESDGAVPLDRILGTVSRVERNGRPVRLARGKGAAIVARMSRSGLLDRLLPALRRAAKRRRCGV